MSLRVFAWDANPAVDRHLYPQSNRRAAELVSTHRADYIQLPDGRIAVQLRATPEERSEKSVGRANLVPFGRIYSKLMQPPALHYEIPHANDLGIRRHELRRAGSFLLRRFIKVSARKIDFTAAAFKTRTRALTNSNLSSSSLIQANV